VLWKRNLWAIEFQPELPIYNFAYSMFNWNIWTVYSEQMCSQTRTRFANPDCWNKRTVLRKSEMIRRCKKGTIPLSFVIPESDSEVKTTGTKRTLGDGDRPTKRKEKDRQVLKLKHVEYRIPVYCKGWQFQQFLWLSTRFFQMHLGLNIMKHRKMVLLKGCSLFSFNVFGEKKTGTREVHANLFLLRNKKINSNPEIPNLNFSWNRETF